MLQRGFSSVLSILILIIIILATGVTVYYSKIQKTTSDLIPNPSSPPVQTEIPTGLKTYLNPKYKFSIQYPSDWVLVPYASADIIPGLKPENDENYKDPYHSAFSIREGCYDPEVKKLDFKEWIASNATNEVQGYTKIKSIEEVTAKSGVKGYKVTWGTFIPGGGSGGSEVTYIKLPSTVSKYNCLEFESGGPYSAIESQIISTFKFID